MVLYLQSMPSMPPPLDRFDLDLAHLLQIAPAGYHIGLHYGFAGPIFMYQTHDEAWLQVYLERGLFQVDPIMLWGMSQSGMARWSDLAGQDPGGMLAIAAAHGLNFGVVMAIVAEGSRSIASFARHDREFADFECNTLRDSAQRMHMLTLPPEPLTVALADALRSMAEGDRLAVGAARLGISDRAMKARLLAARTKLRARTTAEAVRLAKLYRLI
jgi:LuxR family transcriptional regulator, quorum-sensing system regulator SdiA